MSDEELEVTEATRAELFFNACAERASALKSRDNWKRQFWDVQNRFADYVKEFGRPVNHTLQDEVDMLNGKLRDCRQVLHKPEFAECPRRYAELEKRYSELKRRYDALLVGTPGENK